jgi:hypothetical protein
MNDLDHEPSVETPDGVSVTSLDELRAYLHSKTGIPVGSDDPVMLEYAMHQLFIIDLQSLLKRHNKALTEVMTISIRGLTADAISQNLQEQVRLVDRTQQEFERLFLRAKRLSVVNITAVFICLPVIIYLIVK